MFYKKGFTLIELLVVVALIGTLASAVVILVNPPAQLAKTRDSQRKTEVKLIQSALEQFYAEYNRYPAFPWDASDTVGVRQGWARPSDLIFNYPNVNYLKNIPKGFDKPDYCNYLYAIDQSTNWRKYTLFVQLENVEDAEAKAVKPALNGHPTGNVTDGGRSFVVTGGTCNGKTYNYWVNNPL